MGSSPNLSCLLFSIISENGGVLPGQVFHRSLRPAQKQALTWLVFHRFWVWRRAEKCVCTACLCGDHTVLSLTLNCGLGSLYSGHGVIICRSSWLPTGLNNLAMAPILFNDSQGRNIRRRLGQDTHKHLGSKEQRKTVNLCHRGYLPLRKKPYWSQVSWAMRGAGNGSALLFRAPRVKPRTGLGGKTGSQSPQPGEGGS